MGLCLENERSPGARVSKRCWEQGFLDLVGEHAREGEADKEEDQLENGNRI